FRSLRRVRCCSAVCHNRSRPAEATQPWRGTGGCCRLCFSARWTNSIAASRVTRTQCCPSVLVVVAARRDTHLVLERFVDQAVFIVDATRPVPLEAVLQGFGLADPFIAVSSDVGDQPVDPLAQLAVL